MKYTIYKQIGHGTMESNFIDTITEFEFISLNEAKEKAKELWDINTSEEERKSNWCGIHFYIKDSNNKKYY